jgi:hypothetical protein
LISSTERVSVSGSTDEAERHAHRRGIGHAPLAALVGVVLRILELIVDEIELRGAGEVADREDRAERLLEAGNIAVGGAGAQELLIAFTLNLDEVRHLHHFVDVPEDFADALLCGGRGRSCLGRHQLFLASFTFPRLAAGSRPIRRRGANEKKCGSGPSEPH